MSQQNKVDLTLMEKLELTVYVDGFDDETGEVSFEIGIGNGSTVVEVKKMEIMTGKGISIPIDISFQAKAKCGKSKRWDKIT